MMQAEDRVRALESEIEALRAALLRAETSARVQAMRAGAWGWQAGVLRGHVAQLRGSLFWRLTLPARVAVAAARGLPRDTAEGDAIRRAFSMLRKDGVSTTLRSGRSWMARRRAVQAPRPVAAAADAAPREAAGVPALAQSVLIVAELSVPQCAKYRVWQKKEHFERLGVPCRVVDWRDTDESFSAAAFATQAILYRVPASPEMLQLMDTLRGLGVPFAWEVDDLIFDLELYRKNRNLADLAPDLRKSVLEGAVLYRRALLAAGRGIASTPELAEAMRQAGVAQADVVENALDGETLALAEAIRARRVAHDGVLITYGSGTKTHDTDFLEAAPALLRLLRERPEARLRIVGELTLPAGFAALRGQVERINAVSYPRWLELLGESDISLAPLEPTAFNDAKSNIKFLEAAILGVPSVCSPRAQFARVIRDGETGFLAATEDGWYEGLRALVDDGGLRTRMGGAARDEALTRYAPDAVARNQVAPLLVTPPALPGGLRVLMANVFFAPRSYGGATIVVEEMARRLSAMPDTSVTVVTTLGGEAPHHATTRSRWGAVEVFALPTAAGDMIAEFDDPTVETEFGRVLDAVRPQMVHLHSIQHLSASLAMACRVRGIPYVITLHDAWWLCGRQFMVTGEGRYCFQTRIDLSVCETCMPGVKHLRQRQALLRDALDGAALLLSPSEAHRQLYLAQGIAPERVAVAPNGVRLPAAPVRRTTGRVLRFGYVGGAEKVKGYEVLRDAFEALARDDYELILVDNTLNLGFSSVNAGAWKLAGTLRVVPAFTQETMEEFYASIDVLLFPSQWKESFGLTVREALARDVWVVATEGGGPGEAVTDGVNGTLIPLSDRPEALARAVAALLDDPSRVRGFVNPSKHGIIDYGTQALALRDILAKVAG